MNDLPEAVGEQGGAPDLKEITAKNLAALRALHKMTQLELGELLNYSDKAISKWERGEAVPDAYVLCELSRIFGVSVDWILTPHSDEERPPRRGDDRRHIRAIVTLLAFFGVWTAATVVFVALAMTGLPEWRVFIYAIPLSLTVLLVFNSLWGRPRRNFLLAGLLIATLFLAVYVIFLPRRLWMLFLLVAPAEVLVWLSQFLVKKK